MKSAPKFKYKLVKKAKDVGDYVVQKFGLCAEVTLREVHFAIKDAKKQVSEFAQNEQMQNMKVKNIEQHHANVVAHIKKLSPRDRKVAELYIMTSAKARDFKDAVTKSRKVLNRLLVEDKEIRRQLKIKPVVK